MAKSLLIITQRVDSGDQLLGFFVSWIRLFARRFDAVTVICQSAGTYEFPPNVSVVSLGKADGAGKLSQLIRFYCLLWTLRDRYDAVFVHMNPVWAVVGSPMLRIMGKRIFLWYTHKAVTLRLRIAELFVHGIFTASKESFRLPSDKVVVTGHGIDTDVFAPDERIAKMTGSLLTVGRIAPVKNLELLVDAARILLDDDMPISVSIVGAAVLSKDRAYERELRNRIAHSGYADRFSFAGAYQHEHLVPVYRSHEVFVHLSRTGSLDKTVLEAMACGMKVVSCNDAARAFLPPEFTFNSNDASGSAHAIQHALSRPAPSALREYVVAHHNLERLIDRLSERLFRT